MNNNTTTPGGDAPVYLNIWSAIWLALPPAMSTPSDKEHTVWVEIAGSGVGNLSGLSGLSGVGTDRVADLRRAVSFLNSEIRRIEGKTTAQLAASAMRAASASASAVGAAVSTAAAGELDSAAMSAVNFTGDATDAQVIANSNLYIDWALPCVQAAEALALRAGVPQDVIEGIAALSKTTTTCTCSSCTAYRQAYRITRLNEATDARSAAAYAGKVGDASTTASSSLADLNVHSPAKAVFSSDSRAHIEVLIPRNEAALPELVDKRMKAAYAVAQGLANNGYIHIDINVRVGD